MKVLVSGASGLIGTALRDALSQRGADVVQLVRHDPHHAGQVRWDPANGWLDVRAFEGVDVVVNLSGAGVGDKRWTPEYKALIRSSRVDSTTTLATTVASLANPPRLFIQGSAIGFYGDRADEVLTEASAPGEGFLAGVVKDWEAATAPLTGADIATARIRTGLVMSPDGGAFAKLLLPFRLGLGGPLGKGDMWWSWITLPDVVGAILFIMDEQLTGPLNLTAPAPSRNSTVTAALGRALRRPTLVPLPKRLMQLGLGEFAEDIWASQRVEPQILLDAGYTYQHADIHGACAWLAAKG